MQTGGIVLVSSATSFFSCLPLPFFIQVQNMSQVHGSLAVELRSLVDRQVSKLEDEGVLHIYFPKLFSASPEPEKEKKGLFKKGSSKGPKSVQPSAKVTLPGGNEEVTVSVLLKKHFEDQLMIKQQQEALNFIMMSTDRKAKEGTALYMESSMQEQSQLLQVTMKARADQQSVIDAMAVRLQQYEPGFSVAQLGHGPSLMPSHNAGPDLPPLPDAAWQRPDYPGRMVAPLPPSTQASRGTQPLQTTGAGPAPISHEALSAPAQSAVVPVHPAESPGNSDKQTAVRSSTSQLEPQTRPQSFLANNPDLW